MKKLSAVVALLLLLSCDDPSGPRHPPGITLSVSEISDTVGARVLDALTVEVRGMNGALLPGVRVDFDGMGFPIIPAGQAVSTWSAMTNDSGRVTIGLVLPVWTATLPLRVRHESFVDSVAVRVMPGEPVGITALPRDTALRPGQSYTPAIRAVDRFDNVIAESTPPATLSSLSVSAIVAGGTVAATMVGHARIVVHSPAGQDTAFLSVLPEFVAGALSGPTLIDPFGTVLTMPATFANAGCLSWHPSGDRMLVSGLRITDTGGAQSQIDVGVLTAGCGTYTDDGQWIYFEGRGPADPADISQIWRVPAAGGPPVRITTPAAGESHLTPSASPDGRRIAFVARMLDPPRGYSLTVLDLETGLAEVIAFHPAWLGQVRWSPTGEWVAYTHYDISLQGGPRDPSGIRLRIVRPDGTDDRNPVVTEASSGQEAFMVGPVNWSPDGQWLIGKGFPSGKLKLVRLEDGQALLSTPATKPYHEVTWRPGQ